ncbi:MAG: SemiSWEET transporter [Proteobacteria bacterium]|nr:SemiSWEET transporter [Pseudomonadota bacterium]
MDLVPIVGAAAAVCSTASFLPQAWRIIRTADTRSLSTPMYVLTVVGFGLWLAYGISRREWPLMVSNGLCFVTSAFILAMKLMPQRKRKAVARTLDPTA